MPRALAALTLAALTLAALALAALTLAAQMLAAQMLAAQTMAAPTAPARVKPAPAIAARCHALWPLDKSRIAQIGLKRTNRPGIAPKGAAESARMAPK
jgi:hypothetical protein